MWLHFHDTPLKSNILIQIKNSVFDIKKTSDIITYNKVFGG